MRAISTRSNLALCSTGPQHDECGNIIEERVTRFNVTVTDLPKFVQVCGLEDKELLAQKEWRGCGGKVVKTTAVKDFCGNEVCLSDNNSEALLFMPGDYFFTIKGSADEEFPEGFMKEILGVDFQWAKCWLEARRA
jgi:hypothetical protein